MTTGKIVLAGLIAGLAAFMFGFITYGFLLEDFFMANAGSAIGVERGNGMLMLPLIIGHFAWGLLLAYLIGKIGRIETFREGAIVGAIFGFLGTAAVDLISFGTTNLTTLKGTLVNIVILTLLSAIIGGIIGWVYSAGIKDEFVEEEFDAADAA